jgi:hypothetical protein
MTGGFAEVGLCGWMGTNRAAGFGCRTGASMAEESARIAGAELMAELIAKARFGAALLARSKLGLRELKRSPPNTVENLQGDISIITPSRMDSTEVLTILV